MKLLFSVRPQYGHVYPLMPLAEAARAAGHTVAFATTAPFVERLSAWGYETYDVGISIEQAYAALGSRTGRVDAGVPELEKALRVYVDQLAAATAADLPRAIEDFRPNLVVFEQIEYGAAVAARRAGVPSISHALSRDVPVVFSDAVRARVRETWPDLQDWDPVRGDAFIDIVPTCLQSEQALSDPKRIAMRSVPWSAPGTPELSLKGDRSLVYITLGTMFATAGDLRAMVDAVAADDLDVLVALGPASREDFGDAPPNVRVEHFVDQPKAVAAADLVVHHGGSGTLFGALAHGKRQVLLPKGADQFFNGEAAAAAGLADVLLPDHATPRDIAAAVEAALSRPVPAAVRRAQADIAFAPSPEQALHELAQLAEELESGP